MPFVYILCCADGSFYTGAAKDVKRRLAQHLAGRASRYTRARLPVELVYVRRVRTWPGALREEHRVKRLSRPRKLELIEDARARRGPSPSSLGRKRAPTRPAGPRGK